MTQQDVICHGMKTNPTVKGGKGVSFWVLFSPAAKNPALRKWRYHAIYLFAVFLGICFVPLSKPFVRIRCTNELPFEVKSVSEIQSQPNRASSLTSAKKYVGAIIPPCPLPRQASAITTLSRNIRTMYHTTSSRNVRTVCHTCLLYTSPSPRDKRQSRMPSSG